MRIILRPQTYDDAPFFQALEFDESGFCRELDAAIRDEFSGGFFDSLDAGIEADRIAYERLLKRQAHIAQYRDKAIRTAKRILRVRAIDLHKMADHIPPDFFDDLRLRFDYVKQLYVKRDRILWHLTGLYYYYAFCEKRYGGWVRRNGLKYKKQRRVYDLWLEKHYINLEEKRKQDKWDKKRKRVQKSRETRAKKADVQRHKNRTHFNGFVYVDPKVKAGSYAILDDGFSTSRIVYVHKISLLLARVSVSPEASDKNRRSVNIIRLTRME